MSDVIVIKRERQWELPALRRLLEPVFRHLGARRAIVFGSYARGDADGFSDLDLVTVIPTDLPRFERGPLIEPILQAVPLAVDVIALTPDEFAEGIDRGLGIFDAVVREGVTIYEHPPG